MVTRRPTSVIAISLVLAAAILAITIVVLVEMREDALRREQEAANNIALLVDRDTSRNLEVYDLSLQAVIEALARPEVMKLPPDLRRMVLFDRSTTAKYIGSILVLDETGKLILDSRDETPLGGSFAYRDYFTVQRDSPNVGLYISHPFAPLLHEGGPTIALSRRLTHADGSFAGVVVGTMRLEYFHDLFAGMKLGPNGSMALMLADGTMLMRRPLDPKLIGSSLKHTANYERFVLQPSGEFFGTASIDNVPRWYNFRHIQGYPLILDIALATGDIYTEWRRRAWIIGSIVAALDLLIIALAVRFSKELTRRLKVEEELRVLARTDGLTGLDNRRTFEAHADVAWRNAQRTGRPLSLLLFDVDSFKGYNDFYGHSAGDDALISVARSIAHYTRRPLDCAARYGGEEFALLAPDTDEDGAMQLAEKIRAAVQTRSIHHVASTHHVLTVSVGVACTSMHPFGTWRALVDAADAALYDAKDAGRNRVRCYQANAATSVPDPAVPLGQLGQPGR